ncbi:autotransporter outer membrane beta-barrel domain-containing protein [Roseomonas sp. F4]
MLSPLELSGGPLAPRVLSRPRNWPVLATILLSTTALSAAAFADQSWTGAVGADWFTAGNWISAVPGGADAVTIGGAGPADPVIQGGAASAFRVIVTEGGTLDLSGGGTVAVGETTTIGNADGAGSVTISGAGSSWTNTNLIQLGLGGTGSLSVRDGARLTTYEGTLRLGAGGSLTITGPGTTVDIGTRTSTLPSDWGSAAGWLEPNEGTLLISNGASVIADATYIGGSGVSWANATVTGQGTTLQNALNLYVGGNGNGVVGFGRLTIADGAVVTAYTGAVGTDTGSFGEMVITGAGSRYESLRRTGFNGNFRVGFNGDGQVTVQNGGALVAANILDIATNAGSRGVLAIGGGLGQAAAAPGTVSATNGIFFGAGDATLLFNHTGTAYAFDQRLYGTGGRIIQAAGTTVYSGDASGYTGSVSVTGGRLVVNGVLGGSGTTVTVGSGGTLSGSGTVSNVLAQAGSTIAPGNSPGTLTIAGNYRQAAGAILAAEIVPGVTADRLVVNGTATLEPGAILQVTRAGSGPVSLDTVYTVLSATGGVTGQYVVTGDPEISTFYQLYAQYGASGVTLVPAQSRAFEAVAATPNQRAVADAAQGLAASSALRTAIGAQQTSSGAQAAFDSLSGEIHASIRGALAEETRFTRHAALDRLRSAFGGVGGTLPGMGDGADGAAPGAAPAATFWSQAYGAWGRSGSDGNAASMTHDSGGLVVGADLPTLDGWRIGLLAGFGESGFESGARNAKGTSENTTLGLYGGRQWGRLGLRLGAAHTWSDLSTRRSPAFAGFSDALSSSGTARTIQVFGELGYRLELGQTALGQVAIEPFAGLARADVKADGFTERGGAAALTGRAEETGVNYATLGLRGETRVMVGDVALGASGMLGWRHAWGDVTPDSTLRLAGSDAFTVAGTPLARNAAVAEANVSAALTSALTLGVSLAGQVGEDTQSLGTRAHLTLRF